MGCDIHGCIEKKIGDNWVMVSHLVDGKAGNRNYEVFAELASVRGESDNKPKGIPEDVSPGTYYHIDIWGYDGHSHSWHTLEDALDIFRDKNDKSEFESYANLLYEFFEMSVIDNTLEDYRFVFWFDN